MSSFFDRVYEVVCRVPPGRVTTYGDVSRVLTGTARSARSVGWALHGLPPDRVDEVPWWRVINSKGRVSTSCQEHSASEQQARLMDEGVEFGLDDRVDLDRFGWDGE
ncbi:MAG: MGMT family protein [Anaerolineae bacterium]